MTIGRFAQVSRLSIKALRIYARKDLLSPMHVDASSGYRYYSRDQLRLARKILLLREIGMPLERIGEVLASEKDAAGAILADFWHNQEERQRARAATVAYLQAYLQGEEHKMSYTVRSKRLPDMTTISVTRRVGIGDLPAYLSATIARLQDMAQSQGAAAGPPIARYHGEVNEDSDGPVEVCLPISGSVNPTEDVELKDWPALEVAYTVVTRRQGMFPEVLGAYDACYEWIRTRGKKFEGSPMEIYPYDPEEGGLDDPFFEVAWAYA